MHAKHVFKRWKDKVYVKDPSEKWGGLGGKSLRTFYAVVVFVVVAFVLCFGFLTLILLSF